MYFFVHVVFVSQKLCGHQVVKALASNVRHWVWLRVTPHFSACLYMEIYTKPLPYRSSLTSIWVLYLFIKSEDRFHCWGSACQKWCGGLMEHERSLDWVPVSSHFSSWLHMEVFTKPLPQRSNIFTIGTFYLFIKSEGGFLSLGGVY